MTVCYIKRGKFGFGDNRHTGDCVKMEAEIAVMLLQNQGIGKIASTHQKLEEGRKRHSWDPLGSECGLANTLSSDFQSCERTNFCDVQPPSMWNLVMAALDNGYMLRLGRICHIYKLSNFKRGGYMHISSGRISDGSLGLEMQQIPRDWVEQGSSVSLWAAEVGFEVDLDDLDTNCFNGHLCWPTIVLKFLGWCNAVRIVESRAPSPHTPH